MATRRWLTLIAVVVGLGCLQVTQRTALVLKGYALGERLHDVHTQETDVSWLRSQVEELSSPVHLAQVAQTRQLKFVAWSTLDSRPEGTRPFVRIAAANAHMGPHGASDQ